MRKTMLLFFGFLVPLIAFSAEKTKPSPFIGVLQPGEFEGDCGCSLSTPKKNNIVLFSDFGEKPVMKINGEIIELKRVENSRDKKKAEKKGDTFFEVYKAGDLEVRVDYKITFTCPPKSESCEVTKYSAKMTAKKGKQTETRQLDSDCGC